MTNSELKLIALLAQGGQANLYLGRSLGRLVVFKCFLAPWDDSRESFSLQKLRHPLVPRVIGRSLDLEYPGLVVEYFPGSNLRLVLNYLADTGRLLSLAALSYIGSSLFKGLDYIHSQGIIHNDLSPSNVLLPLDGSLRLCDFGSAFLHPQDYSGLPFGKREYMAPELLNGQIPTRQSDFYALASIINELSASRAEIKMAMPEAYYWLKQARFSWGFLRPRTVPRITLARELAHAGQAEVRKLAALALMPSKDAGGLLNKKIKFYLF